MRYSRCLFCENPKIKREYFCKFCKDLYGPYKSEAWFKELVRMEQLQNKITKYESANYNVEFMYKTESNLGSSRSRGRPKTTTVIESYIRSIYNPSYSVRRLTYLCNSVGLEVSRESVRTIINKIKNDKKLQYSLDRL
jgi:hypothetical protein